MSDVGFGISGAAVTRAADAMLRSLGADEVSLVFAATGVPNDPSVQLGLVDPGVVEVSFSPVVVRRLAAAGDGPRIRQEFLLGGSAVAATVVDRDVASAQALFDSALGVMHDGKLLHIESVTTEYFAGTAYLYRVVGVE
ncbi:MAG TPA: hypothetical protein VLV49_17780 [Terriglobales bacterium]|nr:hypothetical protein [Terriglobales bacterium]